MKIAFMGSPEFAVPCLEALFNAGHELLAITPPDRPKGRGHALCACPVKLCADQLGIPSYQTARVKGKDAVDALLGFAPELFVTAAFGQILSERNLSIPKLGCINVHASLLPKYRGAAPINFAIMNGETHTGVTTMLTDIGLDTGDMLMAHSTPIGELETAGELTKRLSVMGAQLLMQTIDALFDGTLVRTKQDESAATKCGIITKEMTHVSFEKTAHEVHNFIRALAPVPTAFALLNGEPVKLLSSRPVENNDYISQARCFAPGTCFIADSKRGLFVATGDSAIEITALQFKNGKALEARTLLNGKRLSMERFE